ncbi:hypothetical protein TNCV_2638471 [Trichonephila clavipes]|nr:hypothetical protein TNCV_2638471 [Trichonephila clavipes]
MRLVAPLLVMTGELCHGSDGSRSHTRSIAQQTQSVTHYSVSTRRHRLQQSGISARHSLLRLPLTRNHRCLRRQWYDERWTWTRNGATLCLLMNPASACNITMVGFEFRDTVVRGCLNVALCIVTLLLHPISCFGMVLDFPVRIPLVRVADILNSQSYI